MLEKLLRKKVRIGISEPWEFVSEFGEGPFGGKIERVAGDKLLINLLKPFEYCGRCVEFLVAQPRYEGVTFVDLAKRKTVIASMIVPDMEVTKKALDFGIGSWRGGIGFIGEIKLGSR